MGRARNDLLHPSQEDHWEEDEDECTCVTGEDRETGGEEGNEKTLDDDMEGFQAILPTQSPSPITTTGSSASTTTNTSATEIRRRLEGQAGFLERVVQSCVAGGGAGQDQSIDLAPLHHGGVHVPVHLNFFVQPQNVEVLSAKQVNCEKAEVDRAEMMPVQCPVTINYAPQKSSDDEDNENNTDIDNDNDEDEKEIHMEDDEN